MRELRRHDRAQLLGAQLLDVVRVPGRVDVGVRRGHGQHALGRQDARELGDHRRGVVDVLDDLEAHDEVEAAVVERKPRHVGHLEARAGCGARAGERDHALGDVDARPPRSRRRPPAASCRTRRRTRHRARGGRRPARRPTSSARGAPPRRARPASRRARSARARPRCDDSGRRPRPAPYLRAAPGMIGVMELAFVLGRRQNGFFVEIVEAIRDELDQSASRRACTGTASRRARRPRLRPDPAARVVQPGAAAARADHLAARAHHLHLRRAARHGVLRRRRRPSATSRARCSTSTSARSRSSPSVASRGCATCRSGWTRTWDHAELDADGLPDGRGSRTSTCCTSGSTAGGAAWRCRRPGAGSRAGASRLILADDDRPNSAQQANFVVPRGEVGPAEALARAAQRPRRRPAVLRVAARGAGDLVRRAVVSEHSLGFEPLEPNHHVVLGRPEALVG